MAPRLHTVICSTRPGRIGPVVGKWFDGFAKEHGSFDAHLVDLAEFNLPMFDEPKHPRLQDYQHNHTKRWSESVNQADAFVFVLPEYNYFAPVAFVNAVTFLVREWSYKPAGFVAYGGIAGGLRAVQSAKTLLTSVRVMPIPESVPIPMVHGLLENDELKAGKPIEDGAKLMLDELVKWASALKPIRS